MIDKSIYVVAKIFDQQGCIAYRCKTLNEARCLPGTLEALRAEGVQIVILDDPDIDIVVELLGREHPAKEYICAAFEKGKNVVTANKDVIAHYGEGIYSLAEAKGLDFMFEASVCGGIPIIEPLKTSMAGNRINSVMGIVNGTTNYMLSKMSNEHLDYDEVLKEAQAKGYAESDPTADVGGLDAARKVVCLLYTSDAADD